MTGYLPLCLISSIVDVVKASARLGLLGTPTFGQTTHVTAHFQLSGGMVNLGPGKADLSCRFNDGVAMNKDGHCLLVYTY